MQTCDYVAGAKVQERANVGCNYTASEWEYTAPEEEEVEIQPGVPVYCE